MYVFEHTQYGNRIDSADKSGKNSDFQKWQWNWEGATKKKQHQRWKEPTPYWLLLARENCQRTYANCVEQCPDDSISANGSNVPEKLLILQKISGFKDNEWQKINEEPRRSQINLDIYFEKESSIFLWKNQKRIAHLILKYKWEEKTRGNSKPQ